MAACAAGREESWICPENLSKSLGKAIQIAMVLATPGHFESGWLPKKLSETLGVSTRVVSALCGRREPVSGWDVLARQPKPVRWLAPAGSVYFLEVSEGAGSALADLWLSPVSDDESACLDGYGLALFFPTSW